VDDLELDPVRVLEKHRVVARGILGELARRAVERREVSRRHEPLAEPIHLLARVDAEGEVIQPRPLAMEAAATEARFRGDEPDVHAAVGERGHAAFVVDRAPLEIAEKVPVEGQRRAGQSYVDLQMIEPRRHAYQNFSHLTLLRSMPFFTSTSRTALTVSPPPHTYTTSLSTLCTSRSTAPATAPTPPPHTPRAARPPATSDNRRQRAATQRNS